LNRAGRALAVVCLTFASACAIFAAAQKSPQPAQKSGVAINNPAAVASGQKIYAKQCEICHYATSKAKKIGPGLANIYPSGKFSNGKKWTTQQCVCGSSPGARTCQDLKRRSSQMKSASYLPTFVRSKNLSIPKRKNPQAISESAHSF
jgi:hypothetical protein